MSELDDRYSQSADSSAHRQEEYATKARHRGITPRAVFLGLILMIVNTFWITIMEVRWYTLDITSLPIFITPVFILFLLSLFNRLLIYRGSRMTFASAELIIIYIIVVTGAVFAGHDMLQNMFGALGHAEYMGTPEKGWRERFFQFIPQSFFVWDREALKGFYEGNVSPYSWSILKFWLPPLLVWAGLILTFVCMFLCLNYLILSRWTQHERLVFPLIQLPLAMVEQEGGFWRSKVMWGGFFTAMAVSGLNGLHWLVPSVPYLQWIKLYDWGPLLSSRPWNAVGDFRTSCYPFAIGLAYFIPADLAFSCWFFYLFRKIFQVFGAVVGLDAPQNRGFPFLSEQASGAWLMLGLLFFWSARSTFSEAWRTAWHSDHPDKRLYRICWIGLGTGTLILALYAYWVQLTWWVALLFFGIYFLLAFAITRVRAELGAPHEIYFVNPQRILFDVFTLKGLGVQNLTVLQSFYWFNRGYRCHPMPNQLEALRMGQVYRISPAQMGILLLSVSVISFAVVCWANLHVTYAYGGDAKALGFKDWVGEESFGRLNSWLTEDPYRNPSRWYYFFGGGVVAALLRSLRGLFAWWPLHPAGYALGISYAVDYFWFAFLLGWLFKVTLIRLGGARAHRFGAPFALGLILGDFTTGSLWAITGMLLDVPTYKIYI